MYQTCSRFRHCAVTTLTGALLASHNVDAQSLSPEALRARVGAYVAGHDVQILTELVRLVAIPNLASDAANIRVNADFLVQLMSNRGITARLLQSPTGGPPVVYGELLSPGASRTVVLYAHYDGQP